MLNFLGALLDAALTLALQILPNQFVRNPLFCKRMLANHLRVKGVRVTKYLPIAKDQVADDPSICAVAEAQVALAWGLAKGDAVIPALGYLVSMAENWAVLDLQQTNEELARIATAHQQTHTIAPDWGPDWDPPQDYLRSSAEQMHEFQSLGHIAFKVADLDAMAQVWRDQGSLQKIDRLVTDGKAWLICLRSTDTQFL